MAIKKKRGLNRLQTWMDSETGQMFLNYAYSWGASIVILGALFKLTHIAGADLMLFIGMGTEVVVFFLSGFERPWDKVENDEVVEAQLAEEEPEEGVDNVVQTAGVGQTVIVGGGVPAGGTIVIGGGAGSASAGDGRSEEMSGAAAQGQAVDASQLAGAIASSPAFNMQPFNGMTPEMEEATKEYIGQLQELTDTLKKVAEQSARLTRDSEEMENMNRTLTSINKFYEIQLRSVSAQSNTIDDVNAQTVKLAAQLEELNAVYARMVDALKVNMK